MTLVGGGECSTGVFAMDFSQPHYQFPSGASQLDIAFTFKKSVFFADHVFICLGSGITSVNCDPHITQVGCFVSIYPPPR